MKYILVAALILGGCSTEPLMQIDNSNNTLNVGSKYKDDRVINFRSKRIR